MTEAERYDDPALAQRVRVWMWGAAPDAAPERLVHAVMDEVERTGTGTPRVAANAAHLLAGVARYAALAVVIAVGVAAGTIISTDFRTGGTPPWPIPSHSASPEPEGSAGPVPSLAPVAGIGLGAVALATDGDDLWVATHEGELVQFDAETGTERGRTTIDVVASALAVADGAVWVASSDGELLRFQIDSRETSRISGASGARVVTGEGGVWLGGTDQVLRVDPATDAVTATFAVPGHRADFPILQVGDELWVSTNSAIVRLDATTGTQLGSVPGDSSHLVTAAGALWASRGTELLRIDLATGDIRFLGGFLGAAGAASDSAHVWSLGPPGADFGELVEVDAATGDIATRTRIDGEVVAVVATDDAVWVARNGDPGLLRFESGSR